MDLDKLKGFTGGLTIKKVNVKVVEKEEMSADEKRIQEILKKRSDAYKASIQGVLSGIIQQESVIEEIVEEEEEQEEEEEEEKEEKRARRIPSQKPRFLSRETESRPMTAEIDIQVDEINQESGSFHTLSPEKTKSMTPIPSTASVKSRPVSGPISLLTRNWSTDLEDIKRILISARTARKGVYDGYIIPDLSTLLKHCSTLVDKDTRILECVRQVADRAEEQGEVTMWESKVVEGYVKRGVVCGLNATIQCLPALLVGLTSHVVEIRYGFSLFF